MFLLLFKRNIIEWRGKDNLAVDPLRFWAHLTWKKENFLLFHLLICYWIPLPFFFFFWFFRPFSVDNSRRYFVSFSAFSQSSHADARLWNSWAPFNVVVVLLWNKTNEQLANGRTNRKILSLSFLSFDLFFLFLGRADREIAFSKIECIFDFWCCQSIRVPLPMASSDDIFFWFLFIFLFSITGHEPKYFFLFPHVFVVVPV